MSDGIEVRRACAQDAAAWDVFVRSHPEASFFHLSGWNRAVERVFGHGTRDLVALRGGEIVGVLPLMSCATPFLRRHLISTPYAVYGGPVACDEAAQSALLSAAAQLARKEGAGRLELRCERAPEHAPIELAASQLYATFVHPLPATADEVMKNLPKRARAEVRKAIDKHGLTLREGLWYLPDLERLFLSSKQGLGSPGLPRAWFEELAREFGSDALVHCVHKDSEVVAATMSFVFRDTLLFYYVGTDARANREYSATNFMVTRLQEEAIRRGLKFFDLGRSRVDSGPYHFKLHQGFEPRPLPYHYHLVRSKDLPSFNPSNPKTQKLRDAWARLPPWVARSLSARLMRYLP